MMNQAESIEHRAESMEVLIAPGILCLLCFLWFPQFSLLEVCRA